MSAEIPQWLTKAAAAAAAAKQAAAALAVVKAAATTVAAVAADPADSYHAYTTGDRKALAFRRWLSLPDDLDG